MRPGLAVLIGSVVLLPSGAVAQRGAPGGGPPIEVIEAPHAWVVPNREGNTHEGKLYFGVVVANRAARPLRIGASFRSYARDGAEQTACTAPGSDGPGVSAAVPSGGRVLLVCQKSTVAVARGEGLRVTARYTVATAAMPTVRAAVVTEAGLTPDQEVFIDGSVRINGYARVHVTGMRDVAVGVRLRFLADDGLQIASCESRTLRLEPEVDARVECWGGGVHIAPGVPRPTRVTADVHPLNR